MTPDEALKIWGDRIKEYEDILKNEFGLTVRINRKRDTTSYIRDSKGNPVYDIDELLEVYDKNGNRINNRLGQFLKPVSEEAQNIIYTIWELRNQLHTFMMKNGINLFENKSSMLSKHAFKGLIKQCLAEVIVESDIDPKRNWATPVSAYEDGNINGKTDKSNSIEPVGLHAGPSPNQKAYSQGYYDGYYGTKGNEYSKMKFREIQRVKESDPPHEKWTDTFGNKMPGEFTVESNNENEDSHGLAMDRVKNYVKLCNRIKELEVSQENPDELKRLSYEKAKEGPAILTIIQKIKGGAYGAQPYSIGESKTGFSKSNLLENKEGTWEELVEQINRKYETEINNSANKEVSKVENLVKECVVEVLREDLLEGFDPQSNAGPNVQSTEGTSEYNPYPAWNAKMRQMEESNPNKKKVKKDSFKKNLINYHRRGPKPESQLIRLKRILKSIGRGENPKNYVSLNPRSIPQKEAELARLKRILINIGKGINVPQSAESQKFICPECKNPSAIKNEDGNYECKSCGWKRPVRIRESDHPRIECPECGREAVVKYRDSSSMCKACGWKKAPDRPRIVCPECGKQHVIKYGDGSYMCKSCGWKNSSIRESDPHGRYAQDAGAGQFDPRTFGVNKS